MFSVVSCALIALSSLAAATASAPSALTAELDNILMSDALVGARVGVYIKRLDNNQQLYAQAADTLFIPASNVKIVTSAAALHHFGPDYRFKTEVSLVPQGGNNQKGTLVIKGYGDPSLVPERLWYLATRVYFAKLRELDGIIVDDSYFEGTRLANGFEQDRTDNAYMAPSGALSVGFNAILIHVQPGDAAGLGAHVMVDPVSDYTVLENSVKTVSRGRTSVTVEVSPAGDRDRVRVSGRINLNDPGRAYWRRINNPPMAAGELLKTILQSLGVKVRGKVRTGTVPQNAVRITTVASPRLADILASVNKSSNNFMAEQVALALGAARFGPPATWDKAQAAFDDFLTNTVGLAPGTYTLRNGSGLHDVNRMSPRQLVAVLELMKRNLQLAPEFTASLAVAGSSGTLTDRMRSTEATHLLRAKTGTLSNASALSGYLSARNGATIAFSILINSYRVPVSSVWRVQDQIGAALASFDFEPTAAEQPNATVLGEQRAHAP